MISLTTWSVLTGTIILYFLVLITSYTQIKVAGIAQTMWILFYLHFPLSSTPLILQSVEKNRVGGNCIYLWFSSCGREERVGRKLHLPRLTE